MARIRTGQEVPDGFWPKVKARLRPLREGEAPPGIAAADRRMVEFFRQEGTKVWLDHQDDFDDYLPLREPDLMGEFLQVFGRERSPTEAEVIRFYARFGPVRESVMREGKPWPAWTQRLEPEEEARLSGVARLRLCEPLWWLRERARDLRLTYDIYVALVEDRRAFLHAILGDITPGQYLRRAQIVAGRIVRDVADSPLPLPPPRDPPAPPTKAGLLAWQIQRDEYSRQVAANLLADQLNEAEQKSTRLWVVSGRGWATTGKGEPEGRPRADALPLVRTRRIGDLMTAMYLQLAELVEERTVLRQCPGCDRLFHPARRNQDYCTARCGDAARQRLYYRDRKEKSARPSS